MTWGRLFRLCGVGGGVAERREGAAAAALLYLLKNPLRPAPRHAAVAGGPARGWLLAAWARPGRGAVHDWLLAVKKWPDGGWRRAARTHQTTVNKGRLVWAVPSLPRPATSKADARAGTTTEKLQTCKFRQCKFYFNRTLEKLVRKCQTQTEFSKHQTPFLSQNMRQY